MAKLKWNLKPSKVLEINPNNFQFTNEKIGYYNYDYARHAAIGFKTWPSIWIHSLKENLDLKKIQKILLEKGSEIVFTIQEQDRIMEQCHVFGDVLVILKFKGIISAKDLEEGEEDLWSCNIEALHHPNNPEDLSGLKEICKESLIKLREETSVWSLCLDEGQLAVANIALTQVDLLTDLDVSYGAGAKEYADELIQILNHRKKGLILFQGESGTGKSTYARLLLPRLLKELDKNIVIIPAGMQSYLNSPDLLPFLQDYFLQIAEEDNKPVKKDGIFLLIEEAGSIMTGGERTSVVSNILSMADGYFTDVPFIQIMGILNTPLNQLDPALLRPRRLISKKEFKKLTETEAMTLSERLEKPLPKPMIMTVAEVWEWVETGDLPKSNSPKPLHIK